MPASGRAHITAPADAADAQPGRSLQGCQVTEAAEKAAQRCRNTTQTASSTAAASKLMRMRDDFAAGAADQRGIDERVESST